MGDLSSEPSMEDILSSIKRIIAEEGETTPGRGRRAGRAAPPLPSDDEVLELSNPMPQQPARPVPQGRPADAIRAEPAPSPSAPAEPQAIAEPSPSVPFEAERRPERARPAPVRTAAPAPEPDDADDTITDAPMVSAGTVEATRGALDQLSRMLVKPEPRVDGTLEGLVREMLRPMLREWLDAQLPALVEEMVSREIERITAARR